MPTEHNGKYCEKYNQGMKRMQDLINVQIFGDKHKVRFFTLHIRVILCQCYKS